ncbi:forkhead box protein P2-like [Cyclospora cayetanensis]|uniref:Forkhead box protein P2-like n=1 Tax=Cyclospora cayetanensis TaxID=88456 RepID=A0A6P6RTL4_9EIME|nr:forkhead box protein P2-like [Cyclospora cayetanensis]
MQLLHYLESEGPHKCRQLLRLNRGVFGRQAAVLLLRQLQQRVEQKQHEQLLQKLQRLQEETEADMQNIQNQRELEEEQHHKQQQEEEQHQKQQEEEQHQKHCGRRQKREQGQLDELQFALVQIEKQQQLAAARQRQQQQQLQQQAVGAVVEAARVLHRGFLEHGAFRAKPLNHWKHRTKVCCVYVVLQQLSRLLAVLLSAPGWL